MVEQYLQFFNFGFPLLFTTTNRQHPLVHEFPGGHSAGPVIAPRVSATAWAVAEGAGGETVEG